MGNAQSPPADPRFTSASRAFTQKDLEDLKSLCVSLSLQSQSNGEYITQSVFQAYFGLKVPLGERLFDLVSRGRRDDKLTFEDLVIGKSIYEKGTNEEIEEFIYQLIDLNGDGTVGRSDLEAVLADILESVNLDRSMVDIFLNAARLSKQGAAENSMSFEDFRAWCALVPSIRKLLGSLLLPPDAGRPGSQVPQLLHESVDPKMTLLRKEYAWHIGGALSHQELEEWKLLYHSDVNGLSFNTFLGCISSNKGPTVFLLKDKDGYIYGGYASQPWERHGDFYGDVKSFLFQLNPKASIFKPTGANQNIQWCGINFSSETIPNGIGFGGRVNHFGLFLSAGFDSGHSFSCTTFGSPCLSNTSRIVADVIECWGVVIKKPQQEQQDAVKGTVLERFKEDRHMLNMIGIANSSD